VAESSRIFTSRLAFSLATEFRKFAARAAKSETISRTLQLVVLDFGAVAVESPFYWAVYLHDGRRGFRARPGHKLVYFKNIDDDPRVRGRNYPVRATDIRRLSKSEFYRLLRDPSSGMIVRDAVGPAKGDPFFRRAGRLFRRRAGAIASPAFSRYVRECMGEFLNFQLTRKVTIRF
jgi:hypothetical protein